MLLFLFNLFLSILEITQLIYKLLTTLFREHFLAFHRKPVAGQLILVTGAGHGLGKEVAIRFAKRSAKLILWDIDKDMVEQTAKEISSFGGHAFAYEIDVSDPYKIRSLAQQIHDKHGPVFILVNNVGILNCLPLLNLSYNQIRRTIDVNLLSHFWVGIDMD